MLVARDYKHEREEGTFLIRDSGAREASRAEALVDVMVQHLTPVMEAHFSPDVTRRNGSSCQTITRKTEGTKN